MKRFYLLLALFLVLTASKVFSHENEDLLLNKEPKLSAVIPSVKISIGGVIGFISAETEAYKWSDNNYIFNYGGHSFFFNWLNPTFNIMFLFSSENKFHYGFGGNFTISLFGLFYTKEETNLHHTHPVTGGTLAPYGIIGYNNSILHMGYDFGTGSFYLSYNYMINRHFMIGIQMSPFANNHQGLYSILLPPKERVSPPEPYWEDKFFQIGLSFQYIFKNWSRPVHVQCQ